MLELVLDGTGGLSPQGPLTIFAAVSLATCSTETAKLKNYKRGLSGDYFADRLTFYIRETKITAGMAVSQLFVVKPQEVEDCRMPVVDVHRLFDCLVTKFIGGTVGDAPFNATARHPNGKPL